MGPKTQSKNRHFVEVKRVGRKDVDHFLVGPPERFADLNFGA